MRVASENYPVVEEGGELKKKKKKQEKRRGRDDTRLLCCYTCKYMGAKAQQQGPTALLFPIKSCTHLQYRQLTIQPSTHKEFHQLLDFFEFKNFLEIFLSQILGRFFVSIFILIIYQFDFNFN